MFNAETKLSWKSHHLARVLLEYLTDIEKTEEQDDEQVLLACALLWIKGEAMIIVALDLRVEPSLRSVELS
jgi:hypothetical protein